MVDDLQNIGRHDDGHDESSDDGDADSHSDGVVRTNRTGHSRLVGTRRSRELARKQTTLPIVVTDRSIPVDLDAEEYSDEE